MNHIVDFIKEVIKHLDPLTVLTLTGLVSFAVQEILNKYKDVREVTNKLVAFVLPAVGAVLATLVEPSSMLIAYPMVFTTAQAAYRVYKGVMVAVEWLKLGRLAASTPTPPAALAETGHSKETFDAASDRF